MLTALSILSLLCVVVALCATLCAIGTQSRRERLALLTVRQAAVAYRYFVLRRGGVSLVESELRHPVLRRNFVVVVVSLYRIAGDVSLLPFIELERRYRLLSIVSDSLDSDARNLCAVLSALCFEPESWREVLCGAPMLSVGAVEHIERLLRRLGCRVSWSECLKCGNANVRLMGLHIVREYAIVDAADGVIDSMLHPNSTVRRAALAAFAGLGLALDRGVEDVLRQIDPHERMAFYRLLSTGGYSRSAIATLVRFEHSVGSGLDSSLTQLAARCRHSLC